MNLLIHFLYFMTIPSSLKFSMPEISYPSFRVCGSYCGPGWCNDKWTDEDVCDESAKPEHHFFTGYSCADLCCQKHDNCCGNPKKDQKDCNPEIVNCLSKCNPMSLTCTIDGIPIPAGEIEVAMNVVDKWCCGSPCPS